MLFQKLRNVAIINTLTDESQKSSNNDIRLAIPNFLSYKALLVEYDIPIPTKSIFYLITQSIGAIAGYICAYSVNKQKT